MLKDDTNGQGLGGESALADRFCGEDGVAAWLMEIARETGPLMNNGKTSKEMMDELYDPETGLPI